MREDNLDILDLDNKPGLVSISGGIYEQTEGHACLSIRLLEGYLKKGDILMKVGDRNIKLKLEYILGFGDFGNLPANLPQYEKRPQLEEVKYGFSGVLYVLGDTLKLKYLDELIVIKGNFDKDDVEKIMV